MHGHSRYSCARPVTPAVVADEASNRVTAIAAVAVPVAAVLLAVVKAVAADVHRPPQVLRPNRAANRTADRGRVQARPAAAPTERHAARAVAVAKAVAGRSRRCCSQSQPSVL